MTPLLTNFSVAQHGNYVLFSEQIVLYVLFSNLRSEYYIKRGSVRRFFPCTDCPLIFCLEREEYLSLGTNGIGTTRIQTVSYCKWHFSQNHLKMVRWVYFLPLVLYIWLKFPIYARKHEIMRVKITFSRACGRKKYISCRIELTFTILKSLTTVWYTVQ